MDGELARKPDPQDSFAQVFLGRLPYDVAKTFTADQIAAVRLAFGMRYRMDHAIDYRRTLCFPWGRYYVVFLCGRDRRDESRREKITVVERLLGWALAAAIPAAVAYELIRKLG